MATTAAPISVPTPKEAIARVSGIHPTIERHALTLRDLYARVSIDARAWRFARHSPAPIDPFALYRVDPGEITHTAKPAPPPKWKLAGRILDGEWDLDPPSFTDKDGCVHFEIYNSFEAHFVDGVPWDETAFYRILDREIRHGRVWWDCSSRADLRRRCEHLDRLYEDIETHGYRLQAELARNGRSNPLDGPRHTTVNQIVEGEIAVTVARDGTLLFFDGRNRLSMAKLLGIDSIPVVILARHERWQRLREALATGDRQPADLSAELRSHPDLRDVLDRRTPTEVHASASGSTRSDRLLYEKQ
ncbi:MAG: hypothetical protein ACQETB_13645 [Halobacteriota archaeon]